MPKRDRGAGFKAVTALFLVSITVLTVVALFEAGRSVGVAEGEYEAQSDTYARHAEQDIQRRCLSLDLVASAECIQDVIEAANESERAERDVVAQSEMALWALGMLIVTTLMTVITAVGVVFVWRTLVATQKMAIDTREIGEAQVRSYVYATAAEIDVTANTMTVTFRNFGNSPGSISYIDCKILVSDPYAGKVVWGQGFWSDGATVTPQNTHEEIFRLDRGRGRYVQEMIETDGVHVCVQGRFGSVDVFKQAHAHGVNIVLSDGVRAQ